MNNIHLNALLRVSILIIIIFACFIIKYQPAKSATPGVRPKDDIVELKRIAKLSYDDQMKTNNQKFLQEWFVDNARYYIESKQNLEIVRAGIIKLGNVKLAKGVLGPPTGTQSKRLGYRIIWTKDVSNPGTRTVENKVMVLWRDIRFPLKNMKANGGQDDTCWEELMHALLGQKALSVNPDDYPPLGFSLNGILQEKKEHIYIESMQNLMDGGLIDKTEELIKEAGDKLEKLKNPTSDEEKAIWAELNQHWNSRAIQRKKSIIYNLDDEYKPLTGMIIPTLKEIEDFYKKGGVKSSSGKPVIVPEWVFLDAGDLAREMVKITIEPQKEIINGNTYTKKFKVNVQAGKGKTPRSGNYYGLAPLTRGDISITIEPEIEQSGLAVYIMKTGSLKPVKRLPISKGFFSEFGSRFLFDTNDYEKDLAGGSYYDVVYAMDNYQDLQKKTELTLTISFNDKNYKQDPPGKAVYHASEMHETFTIQPPKQPVTIKYSEKNNIYTFEAISNYKDVSYTWNVIDSKNKKVELPDKKETATYTFPDDGSYKLKVYVNDIKSLKNLAVAEIDLDIKAKTGKDEIEKAFKAKDWKKLFELQKQHKPASEEYKLITKYLDELAKSFDEHHKDLLELFKKLQQENNSLASKVIKPVEFETTGNRNKHSETELASLDKCLKELTTRRDEERKKIEEDIKTLQTIIDDYQNFYQQTISESFFEYSSSLEQKLHFDITKPLKPFDYSAICDVNKQQDKFKVTLKASKTRAKANEQVSLAVKIENNTCPEGALKLEWGNNAVNMGGNSGVFVASKAGTYSPSVIATCNGKLIGNSSVNIVVSGKTTGKIEGLEENQVYFGTKKQIKLKTDLIKEPEDDSQNNNPHNPFTAGNVKVDKTGIIDPESDSPASVYIPDPTKEFEDEPPEDSTYKVLWQSNCNLKFKPQEIPGEYYSNFSTEVTFDRIENPVKIWAEIWKFSDGSYETIGQSDQIEIEVIPPQFSMEFDPAQDKAKIGKEVKVSIIAKPPVDKDLIDYRWVEPTDRMEYDNGKIGFTPKNGKTVNFHVIARVPHYGDTIDDKIKDQYTPGEYIVIAKLIGPKFDKEYQEWSAADKGLVTKKRKLVTGQAILADATTEGLDNDEVNYEWNSNEGCHIDAGNYSDEVTVSRNEAGTCTLDVIAYDKEKRRLGSDQISFEISEQDSGSVKSTGNKDEAAKNKTDEDKAAKDKAEKEKADREKEQKQKDAQTAIKNAEEQASKGNFEEAIASANKAAELDPENKEIKDKLEVIKKNKEKTSTKIEEIKGQIKNGNIEEAEKAISEIEKELPGSSIKDQLKGELTKAKDDFVSKTISSSKSKIKMGKLETAIEEMEKASKLDPENTELKELLTKTKEDKQKITSLNEQFKEAINSGDYNKADKILEEMKTISTYDPEVQDATKTLSNESFNKRSELNNKMNNLDKLISQGNIDQAIAEAEAIINEATNVNHAESITATTKNLLNDLKNKKTICDANIAEAERLISEGSYENAKTHLEAVKRALPGYKPALELEAKLNEIFSQQNATKNKQKELSDQAFLEMNQCNYDKAVELINQAKELNPDNAEIARNAYDINNKNTIFHQDLDRAKLYLNRGDIDFAKEELAKHQNYCTSNSDYIAVQELINDYYKSKDSEIQAKIAEIKALLSAKEYTKVSNMAKETRSTLKPAGEALIEINSLETQAIKKLSDKKGAINYFNIAQTHYNQYSYEGCLKQLDILDSQYPDCWEASDGWPERVAQLRADALDKYNRVNALVPVVKEAASSDNTSIDQLKEAYKQSEELVSLKPKNYDYNSYKETIKSKLALAEMASSQEVTKAYEELKVAEDLYNQNEPGKAAGQFERTFAKYDSKLNKNDPRYIHYKDIERKNAEVLRNYKAVLSQYKDIFEVFEGEFDINILNRSFVKRMREVAKAILSVVPNKQLAANSNKLEESANEFEKLINEQIDRCKEIARTGTASEIKENCGLANKFDPENQEVIAILRNANNPPVVSKPEIYSPPTETKISDNGNIAGCQFTNTARFNISKASFISKIELWYNWQQGQNALSYTLHFPSGELRNGTLYRRDCDPYQKSWCNAADDLNIALQPGNYAVTVSAGRICQNSGTGGNGVIRIYSGPIRQSNPQATASNNLPSPDMNLTREYLNSTKNHNNYNSNQQSAGSGQKSSFDGHYSGPCRFYGASGNCNITLDIINGQISGNMTAIIDGDNVSASLSGSFSPPAARYSQNSAPVSARIINGKIKDNTLHKTVTFAGNLTGTIYPAQNKANGTFKTILTGKSGGPDGEWNLLRGGSTTRSTTTTKSNVAPRVIFINKSGTPVHFYGKNESCSPNNKVYPGKKHIRAIMIGYSNSSVRTFFAGRNGSTIAKVDIPASMISQKGQKVYVIYDSSGRLTIQNNQGSDAGYNQSYNTPQYKTIKVVFKNESSLPTHFYEISEGCRPNNKVMPGQTIQLNQKLTGNVTRYAAGRNGKTLMYKDISTGSVNNNETVRFIYNKSGWLTRVK